MQRIGLAPGRPGGQRPRQAVLHQVVGRRPVPGQGKREAPQPRNFGFDGMRLAEAEQHALCVGGWRAAITPPPATLRPNRSEEHTSELQSLMRISYAVFSL